MRRALALLLAAAAASACGLLSRDFRVSGTITIAAHLQSRAPRTNSVLFIIAKNMGGVPVAVRRVVNPQFPVSFILTSEDLIVPGSHPNEALLLQVEMNTHGNVGTPIKGDLEGTYHGSVTPGERGVHIVVDRQL